jgi:hypothetical protein
MFQLGIFWCQEHPTSYISWMKTICDIFREKQPTKIGFIYFSVLVRFTETFVIFPNHCRKIWKTSLASAIGIFVFIYLCLLGIGRQIFQTTIGILFCVFLCLLGIGRQMCPCAIGIVFCIFFFLLELEDKFVQLQLEFELELELD